MSDFPRRPRSTTRSRRLRKKLHVDEFRELGFHLRFAFAEHVDPLARLRFWDAFLAEAIEARKLTYGGAETGFVAAERGSATEDDRRHVREWLAARAEPGVVEVGPLVDAWYDDPEADVLHATASC